MDRERVIKEAKEFLEKIEKQEEEYKFIKKKGWK